MKRITLILSITLTIVLVVGLGVGYKFLIESQPKNSQKSDDVEYQIIVDDEIKVYVGQENYISPYLISNDGTVESARFDYKPSSESISVGFDGLVTIKSIPTEAVYLEISERNTGAFKRIKLNVIESLESVLGLIAPDGNLIQGSQTLIVGNTYALSVVTEPKDLSIENYCTVNTTDNSGVSKEVFNITYDGGKVLLTVVGIGEGKIFIRVVNDQNEEIHYSDMSFQATMTDKVLTNKLLEQSGNPLLSKGELAQIDSIVVDKSITDLESIKALPNLSTVFIDSEEVLQFENKSKEYCYRVSEDLFYQYYADKEWDGYQSNLMPFDDKLSGLYTVYHSDKAKEVSFEKIYPDYELNKYEAIGYENTNWRDKEGNIITNDDVQAITKNGIHIYAVWSPIEYHIVYHIRDFSVSETDTWNYETNKPLRNMSSFGENIERTGYRFSGWTDNSGTSIYSENVKYKDGESYTQLTDTVDKYIHLYDLWEPVEYTIVFDTPEDTVPLEDESAKYGKSYTLPTASRPGYNFISWKTESGDELLAGENNKNLSTIDNAEIILTPVFEEIQYKVKFDLNGGFAPFDNNMVTGYEVVLNYTQQYTLPTLTKTGYTVYSWVCSTNGKIYSETETIYKEFTTACEVTFRAVWTEAAYTVNYDCAGGAYDGESTFTTGRFWNDGSSLKVPVREGYTFIGWLDEERNVTYRIETPEWSSNLIHSSSENGAVFNLKAQWSPNTYIVTLGPDDGSIVPNKISVVFGKAYGEIPTPSKVGYTFVGWYLGNTKINSTTKVTTPKNHSLTPKWTANRYTVSFNSDGGTSCQSIVAIYDGAYGSLPTPTHGNEDGDGGYYTVDFVGWYLVDENGKLTTQKISSTSIVSEARNHTLIASWNRSWVSTKKSCLVKGTLIMLPDGTYEKIESLSVGDSVLTFDHMTGEYVESQIAFSFYANSEIKVISLQFSNGTVLKMANGGHGIFDLTLNKYILITPCNVEQYVGHRFSYVTFVEGYGVQSEVELVSYEITTQLVERYDIATANQLNHIAEGVLSCSDTLVGFCNAFEFDEDLTYDEEQMNSDIQKIGLYTYDEWNEYVTYEEFVAFKGEYFKIAIAKGLMTEEDLLSLINDLKTMWE